MNSILSIGVLHFACESTWYQFLLIKEASIWLHSDLAEKTPQEECLYTIMNFSLRQNRETALKTLDVVIENLRRKHLLDTQPSQSALYDEVMKPLDLVDLLDSSQESLSSDPSSSPEHSSDSTKNYHLRTAEEFTALDFMNDSAVIRPLALVTTINTTDPTLNSKLLDCSDHCKTIMKAIDAYFGYRVFSAHEMTGRRSSQEDRMDFFRKDNLVAVAIFDGHGGSGASEALSSDGPSRLLPRLLNSIALHGFDKAHIQEVFRHLDHEQFHHFLECGSTAVVLVLNTKTKKACAINLGDGRIAAFRENGSSIVETHDRNASCHKECRSKHLARGTRLAPSNYVVGPETNCYTIFPHGHHLDCEVQRISNASGLLCDSGYGYGVSRAFGDFCYKKDFSSKTDTPMSNIPDIHEFNLSEADSIVLACDGLFEHDSIRNDELPKFIKMSLQHNISPAEDLCMRAYNSGSGDKITCLVINANLLNHLLGGIAETACDAQTQSYAPHETPSDLRPVNTPPRLVDTPILPLHLESMSILRVISSYSELHKLMLDEVEQFCFLGFEDAIFSKKGDKYFLNKSCRLPLGDKLSLDIENIIVHKKWIEAIVYGESQDVTHRFLRVHNAKDLKHIEDGKQFVFKKLEKFIFQKSGRVLTLKNTAASETLTEALALSEYASSVRCLIFNQEKQTLQALIDGDTQDIPTNTIFIEDSLATRRSAT